jgi:DHA3 family macrolide efflux protein-like MFS transporter
VMIVADSLIALATVVLLLLFASGHVQIWHILVLMMIRSAGGAFHWPAMQASTSLMVPEAQLTRVAGMNQTLNGLLSIACPPLGALLVMALPMETVLAIDVGTALLAIVPLLFIDLPQPAPRPASANGARPTVWRDMVEGFRYVRAWRGMMIVIGIAILLNLVLTPAFSLLPLLVTDHFGGSAPELGWMNSAWGVGMLLGGVALSVWGGFKRRIVTSLIGLIVQGVGIIVIGVAPAGLLWVGVAGIFVAGFMSPIINGPLTAIMQTSVEPAMQGRVFGFLNSAGVIVTPIGLLIVGPLADLVGVQVPFIIGGLGDLAMGILGFFLPALILIERQIAATSPVELPIDLLADVVTDASAKSTH